MSYHGGVLGKKRELPVMIDVDGVCADFVGKICQLIEAKDDIKIDPRTVYDDIREVAGSAWDDQLEEIIQTEGFAQTLEEIPDVIESIKAIMKEREVIFLTAPYPDSRHWFFDRYLWLKERFDIDRDDIIFARDKRFVNGLTFIDDRWENILDWSAENEKVAILFKQPWSLKQLQKHREDQIDKNIYKFPHNGKIAHFIALDNWKDIKKFIIG